MGETNGIGFYNALQAKVEKRFSSGFQMLASYTYSRCMDTGSNQNAPPMISWLHQNYAPCDYDMTRLIHDFLRRAQSGARSPVGPDEILRIQRLMDALYASAASGREVALTG